ncbi:MAG: tRNA epoxyqueuosine(34) reductase QueG [Thermoanaerobaculum sp.]|nr:tRNA epoxyqueuosine(34) reductase QueG [Thermoanaerobaculum sp.]MDW7967776.1 tRNA epoxyqueuosine(34) reductase QueG [Thermoanaerobaculum sp.]
MSSSAQQLKAQLRAYALDELGFDLFGVTTAEPVEGAQHLKRWISRGYHGEMSYMAATADVRGVPRHLLPDAQSVICVACAYHDPTDAPLPPGHGRVARYARRRDYHRVIKKKLIRLGRKLQQWVSEARWRAVVDSAPLLERELAQRAGLGWIGKNTCVINRQLGSELLLGELLTSVALPPDEPATDHCGKCTACLDACPTKAFIAPYQLDARRCIAYLTIEHKSPFDRCRPPELAGNLFGCDACQTCCPWNRHAPVRVNPSLPSLPHLASLPLAPLAQLQEAEWRALSQGTPLARLHFRRLRRNLEVLLAPDGIKSSVSEDPFRETDVEPAAEL